MSPMIKTADLPKAIRLPYVEHGDPAGTPMILLHGVTDSWRSFEPVLPHLPSSIRAFALTQRGHGEASRAASYRGADFADDVAAFMDVLHLPRAIIVGHSMGSANAMRFAADHPERVLGVALGGAFFDFRSNTAVREYYENTIAGLSDPIDPALARDFQVSTVARPIAESWLEGFVQESLKVPASVWRTVFRNFVEGGFAVELAAIRAPTWMLWGDQDNLVPRSDQDALLAAIADSQLRVYPGAGHALHWDEPRRFADDLAAFVASVVDQTEEAVA